MTQSQWSDEPESPLRHLKVMDCSVMLPGPFLTRVLAQYGADVVKIELPPVGDPLREITNTSIFELLNQGKRSLAVNLMTAEGADLIRKMGRECDVFVENFREGVMDHLGLGYAEMSEENPDLIYMSIRGLSGKLADRASHDFNAIANSGVGDWALGMGESLYASHFADITGGVLVPLTRLLIQLSSATRRGMHLVSYMDEGFRFLYLPRAYDSVKAESLPQNERAKYGVNQAFSGQLPHSRFYRCRDGKWLSLNAVQAKHWDQFCEMVDRKQWVGRANDPELRGELEKLFQDAPSSYWEALMAGRDVCLVKVVSWEEHLQETAARLQLIQDPLTWAGYSPKASLRPAPRVGEDTYTIAHHLGVSNKEIAEWIHSGVLGAPLLG